MRYDVELDDDAARILETFPIDAALIVHGELERLAEAPLALGRKAHFPYRPVGMIYEFWCEPPGEVVYFVTVFYHFLPGESVIRVYAITFRTIHPPSD